MKKIFYFLTILAVVLVSCDPMQDINDELEEMDTGYQGTFTLVLSSDDYSDIADLAVEANPADTLNAAFISSNEFFSGDVAAADYIPLLIPEIYPALGKGSNGIITYNFNGELPEDLTIYGVGVENITYFSEEPTPAVADAIPEVTGAVLAELNLMTADDPPL